MTPCLKFYVYKTLVKNFLRMEDLNFESLEKIISKIYPFVN